MPYIGFLDADDLIGQNYFTALLDEINSPDMPTPPDIVEFNSTCFVVRNGADHQISSITREITSRARIDTKSNTKDFKAIFAAGHWFVCFRLYARKLFDGIQFPVGMNYEDIATIPSVFLRAESILQVPDVLMSYQINPYGITQSPSPKDPSSLITIANRYLASANTSSQDFHKNLELCVVVTALNSLFHVEQKRRGPLLGLLAFRTQSIKLFSTYRYARRLPRLYRLASEDMRQTVFHSELFFLKKVLSKFKQ